MRRLGRNGQIDRPVGNLRCAFRRSDQEIGIVYRFRPVDLGRAGVGRDDTVELPCQARRRLSVAAAAIPGQTAVRRQIGQGFEERVGIARPVLRIGLRHAGEMILEVLFRHGARPFQFGQRLWTQNH